MLFSTIEFGSGSSEIVLARANRRCDQVYELARLRMG